MTERSLIPQEPAFMVEASKTIEGLMDYAQIFLKSGLAPDHFTNKPEAVVIAIQQGLSIGMTTSQSLQQIVVIKGTPTIKGDGAKALIMGSGLCGSWEEKETGSIEDGDFQVEITSRRVDNNSTITRSFSIADAIRASLWITDQTIKQNPKMKHSPWYKYPKRMVNYRALGFLARDLYPDVMQGTVTYEEAQDYGLEKVDVNTTSGASTIKIKEPATGAIASALQTVSKAKNGIPADVEEAEVVKPEEVVEEETHNEPEPQPVDTEEERVATMVKQQDKIEKAHTREEESDTQVYTKTYLESKERSLEDVTAIATAKGANPDDYIGTHTKKKAIKLILRAQAGSLGEIEEHKIQK